MTQYRRVPARESVGSKRESGAGGDGRLAGTDGEHPREDENQEGIGLSANFNRVALRCGFPEGQALKTAYPFTREAS